MLIWRRKKILRYFVVAKKTNQACLVFHAFADMKKISGHEVKFGTLGAIKKF